MAEVERGDPRASCRRGGPCRMSRCFDIEMLGPDRAVGGGGDRCTGDARGACADADDVWPRWVTCAARWTAGHRGFLLKDKPATELATAIRHAMRNAARIGSPALALAALSEPGNPLTPRELQVLEGAAPRVPASRTSQPRSSLSERPGAESSFRRHPAQTPVRGTAFRPRDWRKKRDGSNVPARYRRR